MLTPAWTSRSLPAQRSSPNEREISAMMAADDVRDRDSGRRGATGSVGIVRIV